MISRGLVRGTFVVAINRVVDGLLGLAIVPFTLHRLGTDAYGLWALMFAITGYINLADLGFSSSLNRHFSKAIASGNERDQQEVLSTAFFTMAAFSALVIFITLAVERWLLGFFPTLTPFGSTANWVYRCLMVILGLSYLTNYYRSLLVSLHRTDRMASIQIILAMLNAGMILFVLSKGWGLIGLAAGSLCVAIIRFTTFSIAATVTMGGLHLKISRVKRDVFNLLWKFGMTLQVARIADVINNQFDRVLLGKVSQLGMVTHYDLGAKAATSSNLVTQIILYAVEPVATAFHSTGSMDRFQQLVNRSARYMAVLSFGLAAYLTIAARPLLTFWLGGAPEESVVLALRVLIFAYIGNSLSLPVRLAARGAGKPGWEARYSLLQATINVILSIVLYHFYGLKGVLTGTLLASLIANGSMILAIIRGLKLAWKRLLLDGYVRPFMVALIGAAGGWGVMRVMGVMAPTADRLAALPFCIVSGIGFLFVFVLVAHLLGVMTWDEMRDLVKRSRQKDTPST